jgi:hypothetical protein
MILLNAFAVMAPCSSIGLYGVISSRRPEHAGTRYPPALGAQRKDVLLVVLSQGMK